MTENKIISVPEFTTDEGVEPEATEETGDEEVKEPAVDEAVAEEEDAPVVTSDDEQPVDTGEEPEVDDDAGKEQLESAIAGLEAQKAELLGEVVDLRGQRREIKETKSPTVEAQAIADDLKDLNPTDIQLIERVIKSKGYTTKEESQKMLYESVKSEELSAFLTKYPEYKPENDPTDQKWSALQAELGLYRMPDNARQIGVILERVHAQISGTKPTSGPSVAVKRQRVATASKGAGGTQRSSSTKSLTPEQRRVYEDGGWSQEEIKKIESRL